MLTWLSSFASSESPLAEVTTTVFNIACITGHVCTWSVPAFAPSARHSATVGGVTTSHTDREVVFLFGFAVTDPALEHAT